MIPPEYLNQIVTGDARVLAERIPDASVDLIFTDPPYPREYLPLYGWLAQEAARVLKPGGLCITLAGHIYLNDVMRLMAPHLDWHWIGGMPNTLGSVGRVHPRQMMCGWKPCLWYSKGVSDKHAYVFDMWQPRGADKQHHDWGQPVDWVMYYLNKLTQKGALLWEPFAGGGTVPAVCKMLKRNYIAFEIDPDTAARARARVEATQAMHPVFLEEQHAMELAS